MYFLNLICVSDTITKAYYAAILKNDVAYLQNPDMLIYKILLNQHMIKLVKYNKIKINYYVIQ